MKHKSIFALVLLLMLALVACNAAGDEAAGTAVGTATEIPVEVTEVAPVEPASVTDCPEAVSGTHQLVDAAHGICFLYPDSYDVFQSDDGGITLYVKSLLNTEAPLASFSFEAADGRSLADVTAQRLVDFALPDTGTQDITLGGEPATMLDNLPGQDINRRILAVHDDMVVDIMIAPVGPEYGEVGEQAEVLYQTMTDSFAFIGVEPEAALLAGPECPEPPEGTILFTNDVDGFCLLLPSDYQVEMSDGQTTAYVESMMNVSRPRLFVNVEEANGRTLDDVTAAKQEEWAAAMPGSEVMWSFGHMLDGVPANQFDQVPGQDLSRQVVLVHNGRVYTLTFIPDDPEAGELYTEMQALYDLVMDSFSFLR